MNSIKILERITKFYLDSNDFNGIPITDSGENFEEIKRILRELIEKGKVVLNFGDRHPNPHILAFEPESNKEQIAKLEKLKFQ